MKYITLLLMVNLSFAFMYPVARKINTDVALEKYRYCEHDCYNPAGLNHHDAQLCEVCHY